jgi:drug/metabolite transporter (DMT)-like permease
VLQAMIVVFGLVFAHWLIPAEPLQWQRVAGAVLAAGGISLICGRLFITAAGWHSGGLGIVLGSRAQPSQM